MAESSRPKVGLIMTGGGARAAYQVGVLRALAELLPPDVRTPFSIICGTSAGRDQRRGDRGGRARTSGAACGGS